VSAGYSLRVALDTCLDLDWKKDFRKGTGPGKKELAKDVSAMANTAGGMVVIGVHDGDQGPRPRPGPRRSGARPW
jgi:hypothetical protein